MISTGKTQQRSFDGDIEFQRRLPVGAEVLPDGGVNFRVWAPLRKTVHVVIEGGPYQASGRPAAAVALTPEADGYFSGSVQEAADGTTYWYQLDNELFPDPASRFQPQGPHGPSQVVDPGKFEWTDAGWPGIPIKGQIIYEMHIGTFTGEGTWNGARSHLRNLAAIGVTVLEIMPVADFPGSFGWGYDGVNFFAPTRLYGRPDEFREFVNEAHRLGLGVILDAVYNHQAPDGSYLQQFSKDYFTDRYETEWGSPFNFDGENSGPVREYVLANAGYWIREFHLDGLRLDATQMMSDNSPEHILAAITRRVREASPRITIVLAENEPQHSMLARPIEQGGFGMDALWNDDFHHTARVAMTGLNEAYYSDYLGKPQEFISVIKRGYLYQGQYYSWQRKRRGQSTAGMKPESFIVFIQNHDQVANTGDGRRLHFLTSPGRFRAVTALMLLAPGTPLLFQGQEFSASAPFFYFADHAADLRRQVKKGRLLFLAQFPSLASSEMQASLPDPADIQTFLRSKLNFAEREQHAEALALHSDLLRLRRDDPVFRAQAEGGVDGAVLGSESFLLRFFEKGGNDRLILVNLGADLLLTPAAEPLLAPPDAAWETVWSSENPGYGGSGSTFVASDDIWLVQGESLVVLKPKSGGEYA